MNEGSPIVTGQPPAAPPSPADDEREIADDPIFGKVIANYPSDRVRLLLTGGVLYALVTVVLNFAFLPVPAETAGAVVIVVLAVLALVIGWYILHLWNREVIVYQRGFSYREGSRDVFIPYRDVESVHLRAERIVYFGGLARRTVRRFTVRTVHGETMILTGVYRNLDDLINRMEAQVNPVLMPRVLAQLSHGHDVPFGERLALTPEGVRVDGQTLAWDDFRGYRVGGRRLHLHSATTQDALSTPLEPIENVTLLLELLRQRTPS